MSQLNTAATLSAGPAAFPSSSTSPAFISVSSLSLSEVATAASSDAGPPSSLSAGAPQLQTTPLPLLSAPPPPPPSLFSTTESVATGLTSSTPVSSSIPPPSTSITAPSTASTVHSSALSKKRKQSALDDANCEGSSKHHSPQSSATSKSNVSAMDTALLVNFHRSMNHFSDVIQGNNLNQPHMILQEAVLRLNGEWGKQDKLTNGQKLVLLQLFCQELNIASMYIANTSGSLCHCWIKIELGPYQEEIEEIDEQDEDDTIMDTE